MPYYKSLTFLFIQTDNPRCLNFRHRGYLCLFFYLLCSKTAGPKSCCSEHVEEPSLALLRRAGKADWGRGRKVPHFPQNKCLLKQGSPSASHLPEPSSSKEGSFLQAAIYPLCLNLRHRGYCCPVGLSHFITAIN